MSDAATYPPDKWVYKNETDDNVVELDARSKRLDFLQNWRLLSKPAEPDADPGTEGAEGNAEVPAAPEGGAPGPVDEGGAGETGKPTDPAKTDAEVPAAPEGGAPGPVDEGATPPPGEPDPGPQRPRDGDLKPAWVEYARSRDQTLTAEAAEAMTKPELIRKYGG